MEFTGIPVEGLASANPPVLVQRAVFSGPRQVQILISSLKKVVRSALEQRRTDVYIPIGPVDAGSPPDLLIRPSTADLGGRQREVQEAAAGKSILLSKAGYCSALTCLRPYATMLAPNHLIVPLWVSYRVFDTVADVIEPQSIPNRRYHDESFLGGFRQERTQRTARRGLHAHRASRRAAHHRHPARDRDPDVPVDDQERERHGCAGEPESALTGAKAYFTDSNGQQSYSGIDVATARPTSTISQIANGLTVLLSGTHSTGVNYVSLSTQQNGTADALEMTAWSKGLENCWILVEPEVGTQTTAVLGETQPGTYYAVDPDVPLPRLRRWCRHDLHQLAGPVVAQSGGFPTA